VAESTYPTAPNSKDIHHMKELTRLIMDYARCKSGVVIQEQDGSLTAVSKQEAAAHVAGMDASTRSLYMDVDDA
jgi:hypothetical protein